MKKVYQKAADLLPEGTGARDIVLDVSRLEEQRDLMRNVKAARQKQQEVEAIAESVCLAITDEDLFGPPPAPSPPPALPALGATDIEVEVDPDELDRLAAIPPSEITDDELRLLSAIDPLAGAEKSEQRNNARIIRYAEQTSPSALSRYTQLPTSLTSPNEVTNEAMLSLFNSLRINLNNSLSKSDTMNLLASLLTCNESQLTALMDNTHVPIALKIVIKRLLTDATVGDMDAIERLWDRVFGKTPAVPSMPTASESPLSGILPNTPVSREAYLIIRERIIGKDM